MILALVLGGGGARGSYEIGVWKAMRELDIKADIITGTSVGAINGAIIAQGEYEKALDLWLNIENKMVFGGIYEESEEKSKLDVVIEKFIENDLLNMNPLKELLEKNIDEDMVRNSKIQFGIMTVDKEAYKEKAVFLEDIEEGKLVDYIMASSALYPLVKAHDIDGKKYIDGGFYDNLPINMAVSKGADKIIAVDLKAIGIIKEHGEGCEKEVVRISPYRDLGSIIDFKSSQIKKNIDLGYMDAMKSFKVLEGKGFTFLKGEVEKIEERCYEKFQEIYSYMDEEFAKRRSQRHIYLRHETFLMEGEKNQSNINRYSCIEELMRFFNILLNGESNEEKFILQCAEKAGDIFEADYIKIYTAQSFKDEVNYGVMKTEYDEKFSFSDLENIDIFQGIKNILNPKLRVLIMAKIMKDVGKTKNPRDILKVMALNKEEFKGALFLYGIEAT